jgi:hypothetical protein
MAMIGLAASIVLKPVHVAVDSIGVGDDFNQGSLGIDNFICLQAWLSSED